MNDDSFLNDVSVENAQVMQYEETHEELPVFVAKMENSRDLNDLRKQLEYTPVKTIIQDWLGNLNAGTRKSYAYCMGTLMKMKIIPEFDTNGLPFTIGHFKMVPHEHVIDFIKKVTKWSEATRQVHAACYISFTSYLERISHGYIRRAIPSTLASNPTFFQVRDKCATNALTLAEWHRFIKELQEINNRDALIARCMFQGAKRISEVLNLNLDQVDWDNNIIRFRQSKTGGTIKEIPISYPVHFMTELKEYIDSVGAKRVDNQYVFITRNGKPVTRLRLNFSFQKAGENAHIKNKVTPHMLRTTWVTIVKQQGVQDTEIMKVTGHTSSKMIYAYDKTSAEDNYTKKLILI